MIATVPSQIAGSAGCSLRPANPASILFLTGAPIPR